MKESYTSKRRVRRSFGRIDSVLEMPSLIEVQTGSYNSFIEGKNSEFGLDEVFKSIFPIKDFSGSGELEFVKYELEEPKYDVEECIKRDMTYAAPVKATLRLVVWDIDEATGAKSIHDIKEQDVYMGDIPLMTDKGTFIFNGTERVVVSQMHRSPGVFFDHDKGKTVASGKYLFAARVIPYRGSWLDFEFDAKDLVYARIDRRRKLPVTSILYSLYSKETEEKIAKLAKEGKKINPSEIKGMDKEEILSYFYDVDTLTLDKKNWKVKFVPERMKGVKFDFDLVDAKTGEVVVEAGKKIAPRMAQKLADNGLEYYRLPANQLIGKFLATAVIVPKTGEVLADAGDELTEELLQKIADAKINELKVLYIDGVNVGPYIRNTLVSDRNHCREEALLDIEEGYRVLAEHLIERGCRKIGMVGGCAPELIDGRNTPCAEFFRAALRAGNLPIGGDNAVPCEDSQEAAYRAVAERFRWEPHAFDGLIVHNINKVFGCCQAIRDAGLSIPGDVKVATISDLALCRFYPVPLTVWAQPVPEICRALVDMTLNRLLRPDAPLQTTAKRMIPESFNDSRMERRDG